MIGRGSDRAGRNRDDDGAAEGGVELGEDVRRIDIGDRRKLGEGVLVGHDVRRTVAPVDLGVDPAGREPVEVEVADPAVAPDLLGDRRPGHRGAPLGRRHPFAGERTTEGGAPDQR